MRTTKCRAFLCEGRVPVDAEHYLHQEHRTIPLSACGTCGRLQDRGGLYSSRGVAWYVNARGIYSVPPLCIETDLTWVDVTVRAKMAGYKVVELHRRPRGQFSATLAGRDFTSPRAMAQWFNRLLDGSAERNCLMRACLGLINEDQMVSIRTGCDGPCGESFHPAYPCSDPTCGRLYFLRGLNGDLVVPAYNAYGQALLWRDGKLVAITLPGENIHRWSELEKALLHTRYRIGATHRGNQLIYVFGGRWFGATQHGLLKAVAYYKALMACKV